MSASLEYVNRLVEGLIQYMERTYLKIEEHKRVHRAPYATYDEEACWDQSRWDDYGDLGAAWDEAPFEEAKWDEEEEIDVNLVLS